MMSRELVGAGNMSGKRVSVRNYSNPIRLQFTWGLHPDRSMPNSRMASTTSGCTCSLGREPAEMPTALAGSASSANRAAAIWLRPAGNQGWI